MALHVILVVHRSTKQGCPSKTIGHLLLWFNFLIANKLPTHDLPMSFVKNKHLLCLSPVPSPRGALVGLNSPQTKRQCPLYWNMKKYESWEFLSIFRMSNPLHRRKAPLLKTFWGRFCYHACCKVNLGKKRLLTITLRIPRHTIFALMLGVIVLDRSSPKKWKAEKQQGARKNFANLPSYQRLAIKVTQEVGPNNNRDRITFGESKPKCLFV